MSRRSLERRNRTTESLDEVRKGEREDRREAEEGAVAQQDQAEIAVGSFSR